jgi:acetoin utilization deacetylase AcuC-like enzyme
MIQQTIMLLWYNITGGVFDAIDSVMEGGVKNAFALVLPPGHHSGYFVPAESPLVR